ncbi:hypothetical protein TCDM_03381 [Trypanosoma cruzi Dm28c]|uniref:Uncharacterized protein n=1 Tax=Trypanosoma cruzi Dm28c TaxID=1416333 RepID=V5BTI2_TRYCR|nr:hypothetical protein TCDM_03381 [Trypanosoma cruzi Dm28c]
MWRTGRPSYLIFLFFFFLFCLLFCCLLLLFFLCLSAFPLIFSPSPSSCLLSHLCVRKQTLSNYIYLYNSLLVSFFFFFLFFVRCCSFRRFVVVVVFSLIFFLFILDVLYFSFLFSPYPPNTHTHNFFCVWQCLSSPLICSSPIPPPPPRLYLRKTNDSEALRFLSHSHSLLFFAVLRWRVSFLLFFFFFFCLPFRLQRPKMSLRPSEIATQT